MLRALGRANISGSDFRVVVPIDARRWLPKGTDLVGNFSPSLPMGRLLGDDWSATLLLERVSAAIKTGMPVSWLLASALIAAKSAVQHPLRSRRAPATTPRAPLEIHLSLPSTAVSLPAGMIVDEETFVSGAPAHADVPLGVWAEVSPLGDGLHITLWDETGAFDLDRVESELRAIGLVAGDSAEAVPTS